MVKSWTKNVDIFAKDFLIIPINERYRSWLYNPRVDVIFKFFITEFFFVSIIASAHWFLVIICHPKMAADDVAKEVSQCNYNSMFLDMVGVSLLYAFFICAKKKMCILSHLHWK